MDRTVDADRICIVEVREVYGRTLIYPINDNAIYFAALTKKKTLDSVDLSWIERLGYQIEQVNKSLKA